MKKTANKTIQTNPICSDYQFKILGIKHVPEFIQFVNWFATPGQFKDPETQKEFAEKIEVCEDTLTDWKKHPQFWPLVFASIADWIKDKIPDAIGGLYDRILKDGNPKVFETFLRLGGISNPNNKGGIDKN